MTLKKISGLLHLWLGLASGIVVFVVCITGAIWAFSPEIENWTQSYRHVEKQNKPFLLPSQLKEIAQKQFPKQIVSTVAYFEEGKSVVVYYRGTDFRASAYINPYSGEVLKVVNDKNDFFSIVITGHYTLWLGEIGGEMVRWGTLLFTVLLITGIVLWWPKNKAAAKQRFWIRWKENVKWKRKNHDLHNVLGFYSAWIVIFAALSGLVWTFESVSKAEYWLASGGEIPVEEPQALSIKKGTVAPKNGVDILYLKMLTKYKNNIGEMYVSIPEADSSIIGFYIIPKEKAYQSDDYSFDQYSLAEIGHGAYADMNGGEKLRRLNYDIHIGSIFGLPGRIAMFFATLIGGSLPVTGFYIWWGRRNKTKQKSNNINYSQEFSRKKMSKIK